MLRDGIKSRHTNDHKEDGGWANPSNTQPKLLPGPSQQTERRTQVQGRWEPKIRTYRDTLAEPLPELFQKCLSPCPGIRSINVRCWEGSY